MITDHTLRVLEYERVLRLIADRAQSNPGRERVLSISPFPDLFTLERKQVLVRESMAQNGSPAGFPSVAHDDLRPIAARASVEGSVLEPNDLLQVARCLRVVREVKDALQGPETAGEQLRDLAEGLTPSRDLESRITHAIGPSGEILDSASPRLGKLRRQALATRESLRQRLESFRDSLDIRADGDAYVTFRSGRYVIPVPAGDRGKVKGIVHDHSASGQTFFVEPFVVVEENNALSRCESETREEERRVLADLSQRVREFGTAVGENARVLAELDAVRAIARAAAELEMTLPDVDQSPDTLRLVNARHPLLLAEADEREDVVPLNLALGADSRILVLTGPNMGGKTVALKTVGLTALMAACALPVCAEPGTRIPFLRTVASDIGDEQSISENLSTFASHLKYLAEFLREKKDPALVLLDELGTGTDPAEGGALARAYLEALDGDRTRIIVTTHLAQLKSFAAEHPHAINGSMAFDEASLSPTFILELGAPGRSRAFDVATRLEFPGPVLERANALLSQEEHRMDRLLAEVEAARERAREDESRIRLATEEAQTRLRTAEEKERKAADILKDAESQAAEKAQHMLQEAESLVKETRRKLQAPATASASSVEQSGREIRQKKQEAAARRAPRPVVGLDYPTVAPEEIDAGVRLWSIDLGSTVTADEKPSGRGMVHVTKGGIRFEVSVQRLRQVPNARREAGERKRGGVKTDVSEVEKVAAELDLRGMTSEDAVRAVEQYLDNALLSGLGLVTIIHGKGTGVLRQRVAGVLEKHFGVLAHRTGEAHEGGAGVTIAQLGER